MLNNEQKAIISQAIRDFQYQFTVVNDSNRETIEKFLTTFSDMHNVMDKSEIKVVEKFLRDIEAMPSLTTEQRDLLAKFGGELTPLDHALGYPFYLWQNFIDLLELCEVK